MRWNGLYVFLTLRYFFSLSEGENFAVVSQWIDDYCHKDSRQHIKHGVLF